jgi:hypothetical protein
LKSSSSHLVGLVGEDQALFERLRLWTGLPGVEAAGLRLDQGHAPEDQPATTWCDNLEALAAATPALFDFCLPPERLRKAFGGLLRKRGCYVLSGAVLPSAPADLEWLERLVRNNRLDLSLAGSLRYHPGAARLREWRETGLLTGNLEITVEYSGAGTPVWAWLDLCLWLLGSGAAVADGQGELLIAGPGGRARLRAGTTPRMLVQAGETDVEWLGAEELVLRRQGTERRLALPAWHPAAEAGCRLQEVAAANHWLVFPTSDALWLLRQWSVASHP